jgi:group I intron endonuclease
MNKEKIRGIYKITNLVNDKVYIGESLDIYRRWDEHREDLNNNSHHSYKLQDDWNKYGEDNFKFEIVTVLNEDINKFIDKYILLVYEDKYTKEYNSINNGYNIENTLEQVLNGDKIIINEKDNLFLEGWMLKYKNTKLVDENGVISKVHKKVRYFDTLDIQRKFNIDCKAMLSILINNSVIYEFRRKQKLNEEYKNELYAINYDDYLPRIKFTKEGFELLCAIINKDKI